MSIVQNIIDELKNQDIEVDYSQKLLIKKLCQIKFEKKRFLKFNIRKKNITSGMYIWGEVGRGKTLIAETYIRNCNQQNIKSFHYIDFMKYIHAQLKDHSGKKDPLNQIKKELLSNCQLIFIDEFQVEDVADAMIIGKLISSLMEEGQKMIITSNAHPDNLYRDGLQRKKFIDSMQTLKQRLEIYKLDGQIDYRSKRILENNNEEKYFSDEKIFELINTGIEPKQLSNMKLSINDREFDCKQVQNNLLWIEFKDFFRQPTGSADFDQICKKFDWILISGFIKCNDDSLDIVRRFVTFIDIAYKEKTKVKFFLNDNKISEIYMGNKLGIIWDRCQSRLNEMKAFSHLN